SGGYPVLLSQTIMDALLPCPDQDATPPGGVRNHSSNEASPRTAEPGAGQTCWLRAVCGDGQCGDGERSARRARDAGYRVFGPDLFERLCAESAGGWSGGD